MLLGAIADDFTGATDLAGMLVAEGMRTVQTVGVPRREAPAPSADAVVVALKSRTIAPDDAVAQSLAALDWLIAHGARQIYFKYCSTFDSTPRGNIGPVADALADALDAPLAIVCPALPANGRTIYNGHLFVGDVLLSDSPMRHHPLTPMTDASLVRLMQAQTARKVGLVAWPTIRQGPDAIRAAFAALERAQFRYAVTDVIDDADLAAIATACADHRLITAGSGIAKGLPANFRRSGLLEPAQNAAVAIPSSGAAAVLAGSCSQATRAQVEHWKASFPAVAIDPRAAPDADSLAASALAQTERWLTSGTPFLIYSSAEPAVVAEIQRALSADVAAARLEAAFGTIARRLVERGVQRLVVAGGETAGAVVSALGVEALAIGASIDPGVPWTVSTGTRPIALALKSGNFGGVDFFEKALAR